MPLRFVIPGGEYERLAQVYIPPDWYDCVPIPVVFVWPTQSEPTLAPDELRLDLARLIWEFFVDPSTLGLP